MDFMGVVLFFAMSMALFISVMMCRDLLVRQLPLERLWIYIFIIVGAAAILLLDTPKGEEWKTAGWIIVLIVLGWFGHRLVGTPVRKDRD